MTQLRKLDKLELSHSSRMLGGSCWRKLEFRKFYNSSRFEESMATGSGTALHAGIQNYVVSKDKDEAIFEMMMAYPIQFQKSPMDARSIETAYGTQMKAMESDKLGEWEVAMVEHPTDGLIPAVEIPFCLRIAELPWYEDGKPIQIDFIGYIDLIMYNKLEDQYAVWDIKTTTKDAAVSDMFKFDEQCLPYGLVLQALLGLDYTRGFEVGYWTQYMHILEGREQLYTAIKDGTDVQEWLTGYMIDLYAIRQFYQMGWFPRRSSGCSQWNRNCSYMDFCESRDANTIENMIAADNVNYKKSDRAEPWIVVDLQVEG